MKANVVGYVNPNGYFPTLVIAILKTGGKCFGLWPLPKIIEFKEDVEELANELKSELILDSLHTEIETDLNSPNLVAFAMNATDITLLKIESVKDYIRNLIETSTISESDLEILNRISNEF